MTNITIATQCSFVITINRLIKVIMLLLLSAISINAQGVTHGSMPPPIAPGSPAGSYALSELDNISLYSGQINLRLPLLQVGGRGSAGYTMALNFDQRWRVRTIIDPEFNTYYLFPDADWWDGHKPGYGPGVLEGRLVGIGSVCTPATMRITLTRLTFTTPDGTQHELRDTLTNGKPLDITITGCGSVNPRSRGTVFTSAGGEAMTFISDSPINDGLAPPTDVFHFAPSGMLYLRDGTRYRIDLGTVTWMQDRNGNRVSFTYDTFSRVTQITDSVNRVTTVSYANMTTVLYDQITFKGASGAPRTIRVWYADLGQVLRPGYTLGTEITLFPELNDSQNVTYNPTKVSMVELPDGRSYKLYYNPYGEPARVELPTGGAYEYDYNQGSGCIYPSSASGSNGVLRRVKKRRAYPDGVNPKGETVYNETIDQAAGAVYVEVNKYDTPGGTLLERWRHYFYGDPICSLLGMHSTDYPSWKEGREYQVERYAVINGAVGSVLQRTVMTWAQRANVSWYPLPLCDALCSNRMCTPDYEPGVDPRIIETVTTLADANLVSKQTFGYDQYNNQTDVYEYDYGTGAPGPSIRRKHTDYVTFNNGVNYAGDTNIHIRNLPLQEQVFDASGTKRAETIYEYDNYNPDAFHAALSDCPNISGHDVAFSTGYLTRGNFTMTSRSLLDNNGAATGSISSYAQYNIAGNVIKAIDANGNATTLDFSDRFGSPGDDAQQNTPPAELNGQTSYAFATKVTNALGHTTYTKYDYYLGKTVTSEDANGIVSSVAYNDALDRPTQGIQARYKVTTPPCAPPSVCVPAERRQTTITYDDTNHVITTTSDRDAFNDNVLTAKAYYDGLGRTWRSAAYEGSIWTIKDTQFDALGRVSQVSNPYRFTDPGSASPPTGLWTTTDYDALGRVIKVTTPDSAHVGTAYSGNQVTVTDQAGKQRSSETDALGRLVKVTEDPGGLKYDTIYLYDVLGNLHYAQQGTQGRWFAYDSISRLIRVRNMEQDCNTNLPPYTDPLTGGSCWSTAYSYDANGNLVSKTDARNITTTYGYDGLNRDTTVSYSDSTPGITRTYDTATLGKGRLQKTETAGSMGSRVTINDYDAMERPLSQSQQFFYLGAWGTSYTTQQTYDLAGNVKTLTYPSSHTVNSSYDQASRLSSFSGNLGGGAAVDYADTISYNAAGQMIKERFGANTSLYHNLHYNNRLQLVDTRLGDSAIDEWNWSRGATAFLYGTNAVANWDMFASDADNNGNLRRQLNYVPLASGGYVISQQHDYYYDALNRIAAVREQQRNESGQWADSVSQAYSYDRWGNRTLDLSGGGSGAVVWVDDALPAGATVGSDGGDSWTWVSSDPIPYSGTVSHQSNIAAGEHQHFFYGATQTLQVNAGDRLYTYVYLDPANTPSEVMLQWNDGSGWEHRAYWGANNIGWGVNGTASRRYMGPLPAAGGWVRLEVPASWVGLEGKTVNGMAFSLYDGRATWDKAGKDNLFAGVTSSPINNRVYTVDAGSNRLTSVDGVAMSYDAAGNQTNDGSGLRTYDAENRLLTATNGGAGGSYTYDADGRRVKRITGGQETWQVYGIGGELLAEYAVGAAPSAPQKEYGYRGGQLLVVWDGGETGDRQLQWLVQDHLGSTRMVVDRSGSLGGVRRHDFAPFGEELSAGVGIRSASMGYGGDSVRQKFEAYERDNETGLDFAQARYYGSAQGRFTSIDPYNIIMETQYNPSGKEARSQFLRYLSDPRRWNRYTYTLNNPLLYTDPDGSDVIIYYRPPDRDKGSYADFGHIFIYVRNDKTGEAAYFDYYPDRDLTVVGNVDQSRIDAHASITIETTETQEQAILNGVKEISNSAPNFDASAGSMLKGCESTCVATSRNLLSLGDININATTPTGFWREAYYKYSDASLKFESNYGLLKSFRDRQGRNPYHPGAYGHNPSIGQEYGRDPRGQGRRWDPTALNANTKTIFKDRQIQRVDRFQ